MIVFLWQRCIERKALMGSGIRIIINEETMMTELLTIVIGENDK